jgi:hypothetical protein
MTDSNYVDLFSAVIQRAATSAANRLGGPKAGGLESAARSSAGAGVPGNVTYDEDGEPDARFRFGGPFGDPFA